MCERRRYISKCMGSCRFSWDLSVQVEHGKEYVWYQVLPSSKNSFLYHSSNYLTHGAFAQQMTHVIYTIYHIALFYGYMFCFFQQRDTCHNNDEHVTLSYDSK